MRYALKTWHIAILLMTLSLPSIALAVNMDDFKKTYQAYLEAMDTKNWNDALALSKTALEQGLEIFNKDGQNVANLRLNYARELNRAGKNEEAAKQLRLCLEANEQMHGADSEQVMGVLVELANVVASKDMAEASKDYARAIAISSKTGNDPLTAKLKFEAGLVLSRYENNKDAEPYLTSAHDYYFHRFGARDGRSGITALNLGKIYAQDGRFRDAHKMLTSALLAFTGKDPIATRFDSGTRRLLVPVLEALGRDKDVSDHCIAIARYNAQGGSSRPELLYRDPKAAIVKNKHTRTTINGAAQVNLVYTVDEKGRPKDVSVKSSDDPQLNSIAIAFVKSFRYAPAISDDKPVATPGVEFQYRAGGSSAAAP